MWPKCRGRRLPVKLTGVPAAAAPAASTGGGTDTSGGRHPLSHLLESPQQSAPDGRTCGCSRGPPSTEQSDSKTCGCSRKPCCCLPDSGPATTPPQKATDQLRPPTYEPRDELYWMRRGRKVRLTPIAASRSRGEPNGLCEQTRLLPRSQHRRLILKDTAAEGKGREQSKRASDTTSPKPARKQAQNRPQQVSGPPRQTSARAEAPVQGSHRAVEGAPQGNRRPGGLGGHQHLLFLLLPRVFPFGEGTFFGLSAKPKTSVKTPYPTKKDLQCDDCYLGPLKELQEQMSSRPETPIRDTNAPKQEVPRAETLDSQQEQSLYRDIHVPMQEAPYGDFNSVRYSCKQEPLASGPEASKHGSDITIREAPRSDCSHERQSSQQDLLSSRPDTFRHGIHIPVQEATYDDHNPERHSSQQAPLSSKPGISKYHAHIPIHVAHHSDYSHGRLSSQQELLSSRPVTVRHGVHIPIQETLYNEQNPQRLSVSSQQELLSSRPETFKYGIHIPIQEAPRGYHNPERLGSLQEPLSSGAGTYKYGVRIPIREAPLSEYSSERLTGHQNLLCSRPGTSKYGVHIPIQKSPYSGHSPGRLIGQQESLSSRPGTLKHGTHMPIRKADHGSCRYDSFSSHQEPLSSRPETYEYDIYIPIQKAPERLSGQQTLLSTKTGIWKYGVHIPIQEAPRDHRHYKRRIGQQELHSRQETSKYGIHMPIPSVAHGDHHLEKLTGEQEQVIVHSEEPLQETHLLRQEPHQDQGPVHNSDKQNQLSEELDTYEEEGLITDEEQLPDYRAWIFGCLLHRTFARSKPAIIDIEPTTEERLLDDHPSEKQGGQLQEMSSTSTLEALREQQEQMAAKSEGVIQGIHSAMKGELRPDRGPDHISDEQTQEPETLEAYVQGIPLTVEEEPQLDRCSWIFSFLQDQLFTRLKEYRKSIHSITTEGLQEDGPLKECSSSQQHQVSATPNRLKQDIQIVTKEKLHIDHHPENVRDVQEHILARTETITEDTSLIVDKKFSSQQEQTSAKQEVPAQYIYTTVEEVTHEDHSSVELNAQQEHLSPTSQTSMQGMHPITEDILHEGEPHKEEQLLARPQTLMQDIQPEMGDTFHEEEPFEEEHLLTRPQTSMQGMESILEDTFHEKEPLEEDQLIAEPQTLLNCMEPIMEGTLHDEEPHEEEQLLAGPQTPLQCMEPIMKDTLHETEPLEEDQLIAEPQTPLNCMEPIIEDALHEEEPYEEEQLLAGPQTPVQGMESTMEDTLHENEPLEEDQLIAQPQTPLLCMEHIMEDTLHKQESHEEEQLLARPQTPMQCIQPTVEDTSHDEEPLQEEQLSDRSQTSMQSMQTVMKNTVHEEEPFKEEQLLARLQTPLQCMEPIMEDTLHKEEPYQEEQLAEPQTIMQGMQPVMEHSPHKEQSLEQEQVSAGPQAFKQGMQPIMEVASGGDHCLENIVSKEIQLSVMATISKQTTPSATEEALSADLRPQQPISQQEHIAVSPENFVLGVCSTKVETPQGDGPPKLSSFLQEEVSDDQKPVEKPVFPVQEKTPQDNLGELLFGQEQMAAKPEVPGYCSRRNTA